MASFSLWPIQTFFLASSMSGFSCFDNNQPLTSKLFEKLRFIDLFDRRDFELPLVELKTSILSKQVLVFTCLKQKLSWKTTNFQFDTLYKIFLCTFYDKHRASNSIHNCVTPRTGCICYFLLPSNCGTLSSSSTYTSRVLVFFAMGAFGKVKYNVFQNLLMLLLSFYLFTFKPCLTEQIEISQTNIHKLFPL